MPVITTIIITAISATLTAVGVSALVGALVTTLLTVAAVGILKATAKKSGLSDKARERKHNVRSSNQAMRRIYGGVRVGGTLVLAESTGHNRRYLHMVVALAGHPVERISNISLNDKSVSLAMFNNKVRIESFLGDMNQTACANLVAEVSQWTEQHRGQGIAYIYGRLDWDSTIFYNGIPAITADVQGAKIYDPRDQQTRCSGNPALCILDYLKSEDGLDVSDDEIDMPYWIAAANLCDEQIPVDDEGTLHPRYSLNTEISLQYSPADILEDLLSSCAGTIVYTGGKYRLFVGAATTHVATLNEDDLRGRIKVIPRPTRADLFNAVRATFVDPAQYWEAVECPIVTNPLYESQDGGERIIHNIDLPCTTSSMTAQRLSKIVLESARQGMTIEFPAKLTALDLSVCDVVRLNIKHLGYENKLFRITAWSLNAEGGVDLSMQEYDNKIYDWNYGEATTTDLAPDSTLALPQALIPHSNLTASSGKAIAFKTQDGTYINRLRIDWQQSPSAISYCEVNYRKDTDATWTSAVTGAQTNSYMVDNVSEDDIYLIRLRVLGVLGTLSSWSPIISHRIQKLKVKPPAPRNFRINFPDVQNMRLEWEEPLASTLVADGGGFEIRYSKGAQNIPWGQMTPLVQEKITALFWQGAKLPNGFYNFAIKSVDAHGNLSRETLFIREKTFPVSSTSIYHSTAIHNWHGTLTNGFITHGGTLEAEANSPIKNLGAKIKDLPATMRLLGGFKKNIRYTLPTISFEKEITFVPVLHFTGYKKSHALNLSLNGTLNSAPKEIAYTAKTVGIDYQFVSDTQPFFADDVVFEFKTDNQQIHYEDVKTKKDSRTTIKRLGKGHVAVAAPALGVILQAGITAIQSVGSGWTWSLFKKNGRIGNDVAAEFKIYDANGTLQDAVVDVVIMGVPKDST